MRCLPLGMPVSVRSIALSLCFICAYGLSTPAARAQNPTASGAIHGTVNDAAGAPLTGASVTILNVLTQDTRTTLTTPNGAWRFDGVPAGGYVIEAEADGFDPGRAERDLPAGGAAQVNFFLQPHSGRIFGAVRDALTHLPIAGAAVHAGLTGAMASFDTTTNGDGFFALEGLPGGHYSMTASAANYQTGDGALELPPGGNEDIGFLLEPLPAILGSIYGLVLNAATGDPIPGARVSIVMPSSQFARERETGAEGRFRVEAAPAGGYVVETSAPGFRPGRVEFRVVAGQVADPVIRMQPTAGRIIGIVKNAANGAPIAGARVFAALRGTNQVYQTDSNNLGFFGFEGLPGGDYVIETEKAGFHDGRGELFLPEGGLEDIAIRMEPIDVRRAALFGLVCDALTTEPIAGAVVHLIGPIFPHPIAGAPIALRVTETRQNGGFGFEELPAGHYVLEVEKEGYRGARRELDLDPGQVEQIKVRLHPLHLTGAVMGRVTSALTGEPIAGASIQIEGIATFAPILTNENGEYHFDGIPPGKRKISVHAQGFEPAAREVLIVGGRTAIADFRLEPSPPPAPGAIFGTVTRAGTGAPIQGARVFYIRIPPHILQLDERSADYLAPRPDGADLPPSVTTNADGKYVIDGLRPGVYQLWFVAEGFHPKPRIVEVRSGEEVEANCELTPREPHTGGLFGRVRDAVTGDPLPGVKIIVAPEGVISLDGIAADHVLAMTRTDERGEYEIGGIPIGEVRVFAFLEGYRAGRKAALIEANQRTECNFALQPIVVRPFGDIAGVVKNAETGRPIPRALVTLILDDMTSLVLSMTPDFPLSTLTNEEGRFGFRHVPAGHYRIVAAKDGFRRNGREIAVEPGEVTLVRIALTPVPHPRFGSLGGRVINTETGEPIAGARVQIHPGSHDWLARNHRFVTRTNEEGIYRFERIPADVYRVRVFKRGFKKARKETVVHAGLATRCSFELEPIPATGSLRVQVTDQLTGERLADVLVFVPFVDFPHAAGPDNSIHGRTNERGVVEFDAVPPGRRIVVAFRRDYFPDAQLVRIAPGERSELEFALLPRRVTHRPWRIRCLDARTGEPIAGVRLHLPITSWLQPGTPWDPWFAVTDAAGEATIEGVPDGAWTLVGSSANYNAHFTALIADAIKNGSGIVGMKGGDGGKDFSAMAATPDNPTITLLMDPSPTVSAARAWTIYK